jgi:hypothetical protein
MMTDIMNKDDGVGSSHDKGNYGFDTPIVMMERMLTMAEIVVMAVS